MQQYQRPRVRTNSSASTAQQMEDLEGRAPQFQRRERLRNACHNSSSPTGDYSGVFTLESTIYGQLLTDLTQLSYHYSGTIAPQPGNLSYNIPIDTDGNGTTNFYAFVDAFYCPGTNGVVDIINDSSCVIFEGGVTPRAIGRRFLQQTLGQRWPLTTSHSCCGAYTERTCCRVDGQ